MSSTPSSLPTPQESKKNEPEAGEELTGDIEQLLALALGCIGMGLDDFCRCTPAEFSAIARRWMEMRQTQRREQWEQTRMTCLCLLQPYSRKKLTPRDVMRFDWDNEQKETHEEEQPREQLTTEEIKRRYREALKKRQSI